MIALLIIALFIIGSFVAACVVGKYLGDKSDEDDRIHAAFREDQRNLNGRNLP